MGRGTTRGTVGQGCCWAVTFSTKIVECVFIVRIAGRERVLTWLPNPNKVG